MKRIRHLSLKLLKAIGAIAVLALIAYLLLFTALGNKMMKPIVEKLLGYVTETPLSVDLFMLDTHHYHLSLHDGHANRITTFGSYSPLTLQTFGYYRAHFPSPEGLNPLKSPLKASGSYSGGYASLRLQGEAACFGGAIRYRGTLERFTPDALKARFDDLDFQSLMHTFDLPSDTRTDLAGEINLYGLAHRSVEGSIRLESRTLAYTPTPILQSETTFDLAQWLSDESGYVTPFSLNTTFRLSMNEAGIFEQLLGVRLRGDAVLEGTLQGNQREFSLSANTGIARSESRLRLTYQLLQPKELDLSIHHAHIDQLFGFFDMSAPIGGVADASGKIALSGGNFTLSLRRGTTYPHILKRDYNLTQPKIDFEADLSARLSPKGIRYRGQYRSNLLRLELDSTTTHDQMLQELLSSLR